MRRRAIGICVRFSAVVVGVCTLATCGDSAVPTQPSVPPPPSGTPLPAFAELMVSGPHTMAPGESAQFSATVRFANGSTGDITTEVTWISSNASVLSVAPDGRGTAHGVGEADIRYQFSGRDSSQIRPVLIVPRGTFALTGRVLDGEAPVFGAQVEVASGPAEGRSMLTNWNGGFKLLGVAKDTVIRVTKDEFQPASQSASAATGTETRRSLTFNLVRVQPRPDYSGTYTLDLTAVCQDTSTIPDTLRRRRYTAMLTQDATARVQLRLSGADFEVKYFPHGIGEGNLFHGQASDGHVRLVIEDTWDWGVNPNLIEPLGGDSYLIIAGEAVLQQTGSGLSGVLNGYFRITGNAFAGFSTAEACVSMTHGFTLSK